MKNLLSFILFACSFTLLVSCAKEDTPSPIKAEEISYRQSNVQGMGLHYFRSNQLNERGVWGCGIPCPGITLPPMSSVCNKPNGMCQLAQSAGPIHHGPLDPVEANLTEVFMVDPNTVRFVRHTANDINVEELSQIVLNDITEEYAEHLDVIVDYIMNHVNLPKDLPFSTADAASLLNAAELEGSGLLLMEGEYKIIVDEAHPFGYFDVAAKIL